MHMISRNYPEEPTVEQKQQYFEWLVSHRHTLPCCCCRSHFAQHLSTHGLHGPHVVPPSSKAEGWRVEPWNVFDNTGTFFNFLCTLHNNVNATLGRPKLTKDDFAQLYDFYGASQCATAENYGRAFVVVQPGPETTKVHDSILTHKKLVTQGCRLLGIVNAPQGTCLDATALPPRAAPALEPRAATTAGASAATAVEPSEAK
jgi:hypothetical protein